MPAVRHSESAKKKTPRREERTIFFFRAASAFADAFASFFAVSFSSFCCASKLSVPIFACSASAIGTLGDPSDPALGASIPGKTHLRSRTCHTDLSVLPAAILCIL